MNWGGWNVDALKRQLHDVARELVVTDEDHRNREGEPVVAGSALPGSNQRQHQHQRPGDQQQQQQLPLHRGPAHAGVGNPPQPPPPSCSSRSPSSAMPLSHTAMPASATDVAANHHRNLPTPAAAGTPANGTSGRADAVVGTTFTSATSIVAATTAPSSEKPDQHAHAYSLGTSSSSPSSSSAPSPLPATPSMSTTSIASPPARNTTVVGSRVVPREAVNGRQNHDAHGDAAGVHGDSDGDDDDKQELWDQVESLRNELGAAQATVVRLRAHMIEQQTESEDTILEMKTQLATEQERSAHLELLAAPVPKLQEEVSELQTTNATLRTHLASLEQLVEQFHVEKEADIQLRMLHLIKERDESVAQVRALEQELEQLRREHQTMTESQTRLALVESQLAHSTAANEKLRLDIDRLRGNLDQVAGKLATSTQAREDLVDKRVVTKLITTYFQQSPSNKLQVLELMCRILNFSDTERRAVGLATTTTTPNSPTPSISQPRSWLSFLTSSSSSSSNKPATGRAPTAPPETAATGTESDPNQSLSALWVKFLVDQTADERDAT